MLPQALPAPHGATPILPVPALPGHGSAHTCFSLTGPLLWSVPTWSLAPVEEMDHQGLLNPCPSVLPSVAKLPGAAAFTSCLDSHPQFPLQWHPCLPTRRALVKVLARLRDLLSVPPSRPSHAVLGRV